MKVKFSSQTRAMLLTIVLDHSWWHGCRDVTCKPAILLEVRTHQSNDSDYERKHTTPCRGLDFLAAFHKSCPRLPLTLPVIAMFGIEVVGTVIFVYFPRGVEMPTSGNLKSEDSLFCTTPPPPTSDVNALPRPQIVRVPTGLCIKARLSSQPLIWKYIKYIREIWWLVLGIYASDVYTSTKRTARKRWISAQDRPLRTRIRAQKIEGYGVAFHEYIQRHLRRDQLRS